MAVLTTWRGRDEAGSGMTIGVTIMFPVLMLVIMLLQLISESSRIEQSLQATANRAALTAALCCYHTGGPNSAQEVVEASLRAAESANAYNQVLCNNDFVGDSTVLFIDVSGEAVPTEPDPDGVYSAVPPGGTVYVFLKCVIPPQALGGFGLPVFGAERTVVATASVDPYRYRVGALQGSP